MYLVTTEEKMLGIVERYGVEHCAVFTFAKKDKAVDVGGEPLSMVKLPIMPDEDIIAGIKGGSVSRKKTINKAKEALKHPEDADDADGLCVSMCTLLFMLDAKRSSTPNIMIFVLDPVDDERNDFLTKYVDACFGVFGLERTKYSDVDKVLRTRKGSKKNKPKAIASRMREFVDDTEGCHLSEKGITRKGQLMLYYEIPLRQVNLAASKDGGINISAIKEMVKCLRRTYTGRNLKSVTSEDFGKALSKRDKKAVKAYEALREIFGNMKNSIDLPKVKYGYSRDDYGDPDEPRMNEKKFKNFFKDEDMAPAVILIYAHTTLIFSGAKVGDETYNKRMKALAKMFNLDDAESSFEKDFMAAVAAYAKKNR